MSSRRPRIAYVTAAFPFPLSSGYLRHFHLLRRLRSDFDVHLLSLVGPSFRLDDVAPVAEFVSKVDTFADRPDEQRGLGRHLRLLDPARPSSGARALAAALDTEIERQALDAVVVTGKATMLAADTATGRVPLVVDLCDAASSRITQELALSHGPRSLVLTYRRRNLRRVERHLVDVGDVLLTASARDREALRTEGADARVLRSVVVPNGIELDYWMRRNQRLGDAVVFCGNLGYRPNADCASQLVHQVMPRVWARHPDAPVVIVGTGASAALREDLRHSLVSLTGAVDDVRPYLEEAAVFAAPLRIATGIQNKLLEAMAMELPVVTSSVAGGGLGPIDDRAPITIADDAPGAAAAIAAILDSVGQGRRLPRADARSWVAERFRWDRSAHALATAIRTAQGVSVSC